ncbi:MAG TPA: hypothetical protein VHL78_11060 [Actinomycetota bacterium]|nr:hypothetical protein [Actinomycetota bacterium]
MVQVEVRVDDGVDLLRLDHRLPKALEQPPAVKRAESRELHVPGAEPGVDEDLPVARLDEEPSDAGQETALVVEPLGMERPAFVGRGREERRRVETGLSVGQVGDANLSDGHRLEWGGGWHRQRPPSFPMGCRHRQGVHATTPCAAVNGDRRAHRAEPADHAP